MLKCHYTDADVKMLTCQNVNVKNVKMQICQDVDVNMLTFKEIKYCWPNVPRAFSMRRINAWKTHGF